MCDTFVVHMAQMTERVQVRLNKVLMDHVKVRCDEFELNALGVDTPSAFIRYLIVKDKESFGDEKGFWKAAVNDQIIEMKNKIKELEVMKESLAATE